MGVYERNKKGLGQKYAELFKEIEEKEASLDYDIEVIDSRDGNHAVMIDKAGEKYRLNSVYRPVEEARKWAEQYKFQNLGINVFMFGFGNGYFVRELLHRASSDANIFLWEPNVDVLRTVLNHEDVVDIFQDIRFFFYFGEKGFRDLKKVAEYVLDWHNMSTQIRCVHAGYDRVFHKEYEEYSEMLTSVSDTVKIKRDTNAWFSHTVVENVLKNIKYVRHSNFITELVGKIDENIPAIVVSAGPSLDKNIETLREASGRALIIATDTAIKYLEAKGVPYDCFVTVDPRKPASYITKYPGCKDKPLFCDSQSNAAIMNFHTGKKIWNSNSVYIERIYESLGLPFPVYDSGGSVATAAVAIANQIGFKKIILIGQDLAYQGEQTHAGGRKSHILNEKYTITYVDGIDGKPVKSRHDWVFYRIWLEDFIKENKDISLIDATEGGALIHGSEVLSLKEAIEKYCAGREFVFETFMDGIPETFDVIDFNLIKEKFDNLEKGFGNISEKAKVGIRQGNDFLNAGKKISEKKHNRIFKELKKINNYMVKQAGYDLLDMYTFELSLGELSAVNQITGDVYQDEVNSVKSAIAIYEAFLEAIGNLMELLQQSLKEI